MDINGTKRAVLAALVVVAVAACSGGTSGDPTATVKNMVNLVEAKQFTKVADIACAAQKDEVAKRFDLGTTLATALPGVDAASITDAMIIKFDPVTYKELEKSADKAKVQLTGTMTVTVDKAKMTALVKKVMEAQGMPADDATVGPVIDQMVTEFAQGQPLDSTVDLVYENGKWLVCGVTQAG